MRRQAQEVDRFIVVAGYPKSGTTWAWRLLRDVAPPTVTIGRTHNLRSMTPLPMTDVVYIVRDVRDIAVSGAAYFFPDQPAAVDRMIALLCRRRLIKLNWHDSGWGLHIGGFMDSGALVVRYEDLLEDPEKQLARALNHLNLSGHNIADAVTRHSFTEAKGRYLGTGDVVKANFLRVGRARQYETHLTAEQQWTLEQRYRNELARLKYIGSEPHLPSHPAPVGRSTASRWR